MMEILLEFLLSGFAGLIFVPDRGRSFLAWTTAVVALLGAAVTLILILFFQFGGVTFWVFGLSLVVFLIAGNLNRAIHE